MTPSAPLTCPNAQSTAVNAVPPTAVLRAVTGLPLIRLITVRPIEPPVMAKTPAVSAGVRPSPAAADVSRENGSMAASKELGSQKLCHVHVKNALPGVM